jgi:hypothetical protein
MTTDGDILAIEHPVHRYRAIEAILGVYREAQVRTMQEIYDALGGNETIKVLGITRAKLYRTVTPVQRRRIEPDWAKENKL